jgi:hypothetical protein
MQKWQITPETPITHQNIRIATTITGTIITGRTTSEATITTTEITISVKISNHLWHHLK